MARAESGHSTASGKGQEEHSESEETKNADLGRKVRRAV